MDWTREKTLYFISLIRDRPVFWNNTSTNHKARWKKREAVAEVSKIMGISAKEVNVKWNSLRFQFSRENKKVAVNRADDDDVTIKWFAFNDMESLMKGNMVPQNCTTCSENSVDENDFSSSTANPIETVMLSPPSASVAPPATSVSTPDPIQTILLLPPLQPPVTLAPTMNMFGPKKTGIETQKNPGDCDKRPAEDNLTTFASYVIAQVRQFHPRLQIKAKHEINRLLYQLEMENHEYTQSRMERREDSGLSYYSNCESPAPSSPRIGKQEITSSPEAE